MRIFSRTTKVLGVTKDELNALQDIIQQARAEGKAERKMAPTEYLAIEVDDELYKWHPRGHREQDRR